MQLYYFMKTKKNEFRNLLGIQMSDTMLSMKSLLVRDFEATGQKLTFEEWMNLLPILEKEGLTQKEYGKILGKDKTTISRMIKAWESKGILKRIKSESDGRALVLSLTEKAKKQHELALPLVQAADKIFKKSISAEEEIEFLKVLGQIKQESDLSLTRLDRKKT